MNAEKVSENQVDIFIIRIFILWIIIGDWN